jgi:hypothetical protein
LIFDLIFYRSDDQGGASHKEMKIDESPGHDNIQLIGNDEVLCLNNPDYAPENEPNLDLAGDGELVAGGAVGPENQGEVQIDDSDDLHDYLDLIGDDQVPPETSATSPAVEDQSENDVAEEYSMLGATGQPGGDAQNLPEHQYSILTEVFRYVDNKMRSMQIHVYVFYYNINL